MTPVDSRQIIRFLSHDLWLLDKDDLSKPRALLLEFARVLVIAAKDYVRDNCVLRASALTFYSLLSVVPVVAMAFGIAKGFGLEHGLEKQLYLRFAGQEEVIARIIDFSRSLLENTKGGLIAGIGVVILFWSAVKILNHIESALNHIWKVRARSFVRKFTDYLTIMIISPLLVIVSSSLNVFITTQVKAIAAKMALLQAASPMIYAVLKLLPFGLIWLLFLMIYMVMPNTRVRAGSALIAGIVAGSIFQVSQGFYIHAQVLVSRYNAIYGSFAALPLFLIWLQLSWMIVLLGAEIAYAHQHVDHYALTVGYRDTSQNFEKRYALLLLRRIIHRFEQGLPPLTTDQLSESLHAPPLLVQHLLDRLQQSTLVAAVHAQTANGLPAYQPAMDIQGITIATVIEALDRDGSAPTVVENDANWTAIEQAVDAIESEIRNSPANMLVKDL